MPYMLSVPARSLAQRSNKTISPEVVARFMYDAQAQHVAVMSMFPELPKPSRASGGILFRLEQLPRREPFFLVQSKVRPVNLPQEAMLKEFEWPKFERGQAIQFRLTANCIRIDMVSGKRTYIEQDEVEDWVIRRLSPALEVMTPVGTVTRDVLSFAKEPQTKASAISIDKVDGFATITDPDKLIEIMANGIGKAKAYGAGLLTVRALN